ncbi:MAG: BLUF domain-containing protein [Saprospiraceae bacterium]|nr:BLUF domain-containing protein [Saprospiraceae bacterium]
MPVFQLIYRSKANAYFNDDDLIVLLRQCRSKNIEKNVTGILLYGYGNFIQLLEGDDDVVRDLYAHRISLDQRHREPVILHQGYIPKRLFKDWSMAFQPLNAERVRSLSGYLDPAAQESETGKNLLSPMRLLEVIQGFATDMNRR